MKLSESKIILNLAIKRNITFLLFYTLSVYKSINIEKLTINHYHKIKSLGFYKNVLQHNLNSNHYSLQESKKDEIFRKIYFPINNKMRCDENKCDYCCINTYQCGSKTKCDYYKYSSINLGFHINYSIVFSVLFA